MSVKRSLLLLNFGYVDVWNQKRINREKCDEVIAIESLAEFIHHRDSIAGTFGIASIVALTYQ